MFQQFAPENQCPGECRITDEELKILTEIKTLRSINLGRGCEVSDRGMAIIGTLPLLEELTIRRGIITDAGLAHLKPLTHLKTLSLSECMWFTDAGLAHLEGLIKLEHLELSNGRFTDAGMVHLSPLQQLTYLSLNKAELSHVGLSHLRPLKQLKRMFFVGMPYDDAGLEHVGQLLLLYLSSLLAMRLPIPDLNISKNLTNLEHLNIRSTGITGAGMVHLAGMQSLPQPQPYG